MTLLDIARPALALAVIAAYANAGAGVTYAQQEPPRSPPARRALLVGVESYPQSAGWPALRGPRADVEALHDALVLRGGFELENVHVLLDGSATRFGILKAFHGLIRESAPEDVLLFYFAGHGSQLPDQDGDEQDGYDETLVPYDAQDAAGVANDIRDDDLKELIEAANGTTNHVVLLFDCCSSGTNVRGGAELTARFVSPEARGIAGVRDKRLAQPADGTSGYLEGELSYVSMSACRASESAYEHEVEGAEDPERRVHGLFTYSLLQELYSIPSRASYSDLLERVSERVRRVSPAQTPVIEGPLDRRPLFGSEGELRPMSYGFETADGGLVLSGGLVNGLAGGAVLAVFEDGLSDVATPLGHVELTLVGATRSRFRWLADLSSEPSLTRARAVPIKKGEQAVTLGYAFEPGERGDEARAALGPALLARESLREVSPAEALLTLGAGTDGTGATRLFVERGGVTLPISGRLDSTREQSAFIASLAALATAHRVRSLASGPDSALRGEASFERLAEDGEPLGPLESAGDGKLLIRAGDGIGCRFRNLTNRPVYATLVVISPDGEVNVAYRPQTVDDAVPPGADVGRSFNLVVASGNEAFYRAAPECFLWIVTTELRDLRDLEQPPARRAKALRGGRLRRKAEDVVPADDWLTLPTEILVRTQGD